MSSGGEQGPGAERGSARLLTKLNEAMSRSKFYEAHQLMRTINFRYTSAKKFSELESLLIKTAIALLDTEQYESGSDVAIMLTKLYNENSLPINPERILQSTLLLKKMRSSPERITFIANILEWCGSSDFHLSGTFNLAVTQIYVKETAYAEAWKHLIRVHNGNQIAEITYQILGAKNIPKCEEDLVISHLVLSLVHAKRLFLAEDSYGELMKNYGEVPSPLLNSIKFLIEAAKINDVGMYKGIKQVYWPSFNREVNVHRLIDSIGKSVFKLADAPERNGFMTNILNAILSPDSFAESQQQQATDQLDLE